MKANELRIGNYVYALKSSSEPIIIGDDYNLYLSRDYQPIPLTEEWLLKMGFKGRVDFKWNNNVGIQIVDNKYYFAFKDLSNVLFHSVIECKDVHQVQNVYYSLTNEELTIR